MRETGIRSDMVEHVTDIAKYDYFNAARWTRANEVNIAMGQGEVKFTPLQMANFIATLGNGGVRNDLTLIRAIERMQIERNPGVQMDYTNFDEIIRGMRMATTYRRGTLTNIFRGFPIPVAAKTGTAERTGRIHPPCEVTYVQENLRRIAPNMAWEDIEVEMNRLMSEFPNRWRNTNTAVRQALINLSDGAITPDIIDAHKPTYDPLSWVVAMAPAYDPQIAVSVLLFQGGTSLNAGPVAREIIAEYFRLGREFEDISLSSTMR
jgi:penicillin-binding protein 2